MLRPAEQPNVLETIVNRSCSPSTFEGCIVRFADKIAYLGRDIEDGIEAGVIRETDIPQRIRERMGSRNGEIIHALVIDVIKSSQDTDAIRLSADCYDLMVELKKFNYANIYLHALLREYESYCRNILRQLFEHLGNLYERFGERFDAYQDQSIPLDRAFGKYLGRMQQRYAAERAPTWRKVVDYISGMTDLYALQCIKQITLPPPLRFSGN